MTLREELKRYPKWVVALVVADVAAAYGFLLTMLILGMRS